MKRILAHFAFATLVFLSSLLNGSAQSASPRPAIAAPTLQLPDASFPSDGRERARNSAAEIVSDVAHDQKTVWIFPPRVARGERWKPVLALVAATSALVALDSRDTPYFRRTPNFRGFNKTFSGVNTGILEGTLPLGLFLVGRARHSSSTQKTALLAAEGLADAEIVSEMMKNVDRRLRPSEIPPGGDFTHTWFKAGGGVLITRGSFPSGHAIGAFALATVIAERYRRHRWAPWLAYGLAGTIAFSRVTLQAHFPSDVFAGAALGYSISRFVVMRRAD